MESYLLEEPGWHRATGADLEGRVWRPQLHKGSECIHFLYKVLGQCN